MYKKTPLNSLKMKINIKKTKVIVYKRNNNNITKINFQNNQATE